MSKPCNSLMNNEKVENIEDKSYDKNFCLKNMESESETDKRIESSREGNSESSPERERETCGEVSTEPQRENTSESTTVKNCSGKTTESEKEKEIAVDLTDEKTNAERRHSQISKSFNQKCSAAILGVIETFFYK